MRRTSEIVDAASAVMAEAIPLIKQDFPLDSQEVLDRILKRAFADVNRSPHAILSAEALRQAYRAFRQ